jgi:hypothetical protein
MAGKVLELDDLISRDQLGCSIANKWMEWNMGRQEKVGEWKELNRYLYATSTRHTTNSKLPWSNSTTLPKLTQIRDNLYANYVATMFPKRRWLNWQGFSKSDESRKKVEAIKDYMMWAVSQPQFKEEVKKLVLDYIDKGNCFATVEWIDESIEDKFTGIKSGFIGPRPVRIPPQDLVMNPIAASFSNSPKIWRSIMTVGEAKSVLERLSKTDQDRELAQAVFDYAMDYRDQVTSFGVTDIHYVDDAFNVDGFTSYHHYLSSDYVELLTFVGDIYDRENNELLKNHLVVVIDRHKVAVKRPYPYPLAEVPVYHAGWRIRQDNLWAMGPLDNLVGLQYRLDHIENMKSDILDLVTYPVLKIRGSGAIGDFEWGPMERIYVDGDGDVEMIAPDIQALNMNIEIQQIEARMEEMAGSPKEAMGFRTPGEKTAYEVQRLENAASRIFQNKISQFEEQVIEPLLNAMLVLAKENLTEASIRVIDDEYGTVDFRNITRGDLSANGRIKPVAARHFAEQAEMIQNITNWAQSPLGMDEEIKQHFSSVKLAEMVEDVLNMQDYDIMTPYVRISERAERTRLEQTAQESLMNEAMTPSGLTPDDYSDPSMMEGIDANTAPMDPAL